MDSSLASWFVIFLMALAANLPFFNEALLGVVRLKSPTKSFPLRLVELALLYASVLGIAYLLESSRGNVFNQEWQFYAITICWFLVLAFPGFVMRYLRKGGGQAQA